MALPPDDLERPVGEGCPWIALLSRLTSPIAVETGAAPGARFARR